MAGKKSNKKLASNSELDKENSSVSDYFRFSESYTSLILGIVVVIIISVLLISFVSGRNIGKTKPAGPEISSAKIGPENSQVAMLAGGTYMVKTGDDLWKISELVYNDGFKWVEIAKANKITSPGSLKVGAVLVIPSVLKEEGESVQAIVQTSPAVTLAPTQKSTLAPVEEVKVVAQETPTLLAGNTYTVTRGDSLWNIAVRTYGDGFRWIEIARANNITNPDTLKEGTVLTIAKATSGESENVVGTKGQVNSVGQKTYTVVRGDTLWEIAVRTYGSGYRWEEIARANNLANPNLIHAGNVFVIP